jgi:hypothetical protein
MWGGEEGCGGVLVPDGARFRQLMQAIVEAFTTTQEDSGAEKKATMRT